MTTTKTQIKSKVKAEGKLPDNRIGCITWWDTRQTLKVDPAPLRRRLEKLLPEFKDIVKEPVAPITALRRVMARCSRNLPDGYMWRIIGEDDNFLSYAYAKENRDVEHGKYTAKEEIVLNFDKTSEKLASTDDTHDQVQRVIAEYQKMVGFLNHNDLCDVILAVFRKSSTVRIKHKGGVYFMPKPFDDVLPALCQVIEPTGMTLMRYPVLNDSSGTVEQMGKSAQTGLLIEVEKLTEEIEKLVAKPTLPRASTVQNRVTQLEEIRKKAKLFEAVIGTVMKDVDKAIKTADKEISGMVAEIEVRAAASAEEKKKLSDADRLERARALVAKLEADTKADIQKKTVRRKKTQPSA